MSQLRPQLRRPNRISKAFTDRCRKVAADHNMTIPDGFTLYGTDTNKGRCNDDGTITIPTWAGRRTDGRLIQYIAHEIAHAYCFLYSGSWNHTAEFMEFMMILCPAEHWHHELKYRPQAATAAGITEKRSIT